MRQAPVPMMQSGALNRRGIRHGFFGCQGGVSAGIYRSLNCGFGSADDPLHVAENRLRCADRLGVGGESLLTVYQVHGIAVAEVTEPWPPGAAPRADALVTSRPGIGLGILTADCAPVLLADRDAGIIGAAHAGWKGAKSGVVEAAVAAMVAIGADRGRIAACVGPSIGAKSYEVGPEFRDAFLSDDSLSDDFRAEQFFHETSGARPRFDLQGFVVARLKASGLTTVDCIVADTCADADRFFSYRRSRQRGEADYGRQISAIALMPEAR